MADEKKEEKKGIVVEIPTQHIQAFQLEDGKVVEINELLILIYNKITKLEKLMG